MKITNKHGLPAPLVAAVTADPYSPGRSDITVTQLIKPPRALALEKKHAAELEDDASNRIWSLIGQIGHAILERAAKAGHRVVEERLYAEVLGWTVGGQVDLLDWVITDYKLTTVWSCKNGLKPEWEQQLNALAWLARRNNFVPLGLEIVAIYRDWSALEAHRDSSYPQSQVQVFCVPQWTDERATAWIEERVRLHQSARAGTLPECTPEERWAKPDTFAVLRPDAKRARRVLRSYEDAVKELKEGEVVVMRPGESTRCETYCAAAPFCEQFARIKSSSTPKDDSDNKGQTSGTDNLA
jgi:hypothetical protein